MVFDAEQTADTISAFMLRLFLYFAAIIDFCQFSPHVDSYSATLSRNVFHQ